MENINWSDLSFGYMKTDYNVHGVTIGMVNGASSKLVLPRSSIFIWLPHVCIMDRSRLKD